MLPENTVLAQFIKQSRKEGKTAQLTVLTFNRLEYTRRSLESLLTNTHFPYRLTVVDNGSNDGTVEYLQGLHRENKIDRLILLPKNIGVSAWNYGLKSAENAEYYLNLANDLYYLPFWCAKICYVLGNVKVPAGIVGSHPEPIGIYASYYQSRQVFDGIKIAIVTVNPNPPCFTRRVFEKVGYFRESIFFAGIEADYYIRVMKAGFRSGIIIDEPCIIHMPTDDRAKGREVMFTMPSGQSYLEWKQAEHSKLRAMGDLQALPIATYLGTKITDEEISRYTWNP